LYAQLRTAFRPQRSGAIRLPRQSVQRTNNPLPLFVAEVRVDLRSGATGVAQQILNVPQASSTFQQMRRVAVPQGMHRGKSVDLTLRHGFSQYGLDASPTVLSAGLLFEQPVGWAVLQEVLPQFN